MIASSNKVLATGSYANDDHGDTTATAFDTNGVILSGQMVSYLTPSDLFIDDWPYYITPFERGMVPAHRRKNPFECEIFDSIVTKHNVLVKNLSKNVTFNRVNMKGFS